MLTYIITMEIRKFLASRKRPFPVYQVQEEMKGVEMHVMRMTSRYLIFFLIFSISLEFLDLVFRGYTAVKSWDILRNVIYGKDFTNIFILQYTLGNLIPIVLLMIPGLTVRRAILSLILVLLGVFMMRWNVVIGGQSFSLTFAGYMHYHLPIIPQSYETFKEGLLGALFIGVIPFVLFWILSRIFPVFGLKEAP
jgi:hypothetical protein